MPDREMQARGLQQLPWQIRQSFVQQVDRVQGLRGAGVHVISAGTHQTLRATQGNVDVILEICLAEPPPEYWQTWDFWIDAVGATASCGATAYWASTTVSSATAAPFTAGSSAVITGLAAAGTAASMIQCGDSIVRLRNHVVDPALNQERDADPNYRRFMFAVDVVSVAGSVASLIKAGGAAVRLARSASRPWYRFYQPLNRAARRRLTKDLNMRAIGAASGRQYKRLLKAGEIARKTYRQSEITLAIRRELINSITSGLSLVQSGAKGTMREIVVEVEAYIVEHSQPAVVNDTTSPTQTYLKQGNDDRQRIQPASP